MQSGRGIADPSWGLEREARRYWRGSALKRVWWTALWRQLTFTPSEATMRCLPARQRVWHWHHWFREMIVSKV